MLAEVAHVADSPLVRMLHPENKCTWICNYECSKDLLKAGGTGDSFPLQEMQSATLHNT